MELSKPVGNPVYAPLFIRLSLGAYFVMAGWAKLENLSAFVEEVVRMGVIPESLAVLYGTVLPFAEIVIGSLVFLGLWTTLGSVLLSLMLISFITAFGLTPNDAPFNKDVILLAASLSLMYYGPGALSVDRLRNAA